MAGAHDAVVPVPYILPMKYLPWHVCSTREMLHLAAGDAEAHANMLAGLFMEMGRQVRRNSRAQTQSLSSAQSMYASHDPDAECGSTVLRCAF